MPAYKIPFCMRNRTQFYLSVLQRGVQYPKTQRKFSWTLINTIEFAVNPDCWKNFYRPNIEFMYGDEGKKYQKIRIMGASFQVRCHTPPRGADRFVDTQVYRAL